MENEDLSYINIIYDINNEEGDEIYIFGYNFVKNNKNKCKMIIDNIEYEITNKYNIKNYKYNRLNIKLKGINKISNMSFMFSKCSSLSSLPDISKWNTNNVTNMSDMFNCCSSLKALPDISIWNTNNVTNMSWMFYGSSSLKDLPDISKWNISNDTKISWMFNGCNKDLNIPSKFL